MADVPEYLTLARHRDLRGRERRPIARAVGLGCLGIVCVLGLANVFGQRPSTDTAESAVARLDVYAPPKVRSGLYFEARFHVHAREEIEKATVVLEPGWLEGMTLNTIEPAPIGEASRDGRLVLELGRIPAGGEHILFLHFQVNPTNVGSRAQDVELYDGEDRLLAIDRTVKVFP